jgi:hypothetical protein
MTDEQRYIAQGRARDAAKKLRAEIATLRASLDEYSEALNDTKSALAHFLSNPATKAADGRIFIDHLNMLQRKLCSAGFFDLTADFMDKSRQLQTLEDQIKDF